MKIPSHKQTLMKRLQAEVDALQSKLDSMKAEHATPVETTLPPQVAAKQRSLEEMLFGEWFDQGSFVNMEAIGSLIFNADGTGSEIIINYAWFDSKIDYIAPGTTGEETYNLKWSLDGNTINLEFDKESWRNRSYTFVDNEQQLRWHDKDGVLAMYL